MQIYLLRASELRKTFLPERVSGQYIIEYTNESGDSKPLLQISSKQGHWVITENRYVQIKPYDENLKKSLTTQEYGEYELRENGIYYLLREKKELMLIMTERETENRKRFQLYQIPTGGVVEVGRASFNTIQYDHKFVHDPRHIRITYRNNSITVSDCEDCNEKQQKNQAYLNQTRIDRELSAHIGDTIFLFGLKIVLGKDFIAINNPDGKVKTNLQEKPVLSFTPEEEEGDYEFEEKADGFSSAPRERREMQKRQFVVENPPQMPEENDLPWILMFGPTLTMAVGSLFSSAFTVSNVVSNSGDIKSTLPTLITSIIMVIGTLGWPVISKREQKRSQKRKAEDTEKTYGKYLAWLEEEIQETARIQKEILQENNPALSECIKKIEEVQETLWNRSQRHPDFLDVMIGTGDVGLDAEFSFPDRHFMSEIGTSAEAMYELVDRPHLVKQVPVTIPLKGAGIVGVIGDRGEVISFVKALLIELTALHNFEDLKIIFIYNEKERSEWEFVKWIPHLWNEERTLRCVANDPDEVKIISDYISAVRIQGESRAIPQNRPYYLIFAADKRLAERAQAVKELYKNPDSTNMTLLALYDERQYLPNACSYVIDLQNDNSRTSATLSDYNDITGNKICCSDVIRYDGNPEEIFTKMANIKLDSDSGRKHLPTEYTFMEMLGIGRVEQLDLLRRWKQHNAVDSLSAPIGIDADGYMISLDIHEIAHGPHGLIAGMTGSGKSEFIISYIASMAVNYSPEDVAFVLIDFKGGGMADVFKDLPHTAGLITNLDGNELRRSFLAIEHELEKRQKLFKVIGNQKKISNIDIYKYQKLRREDHSLKPLPHLILISDEFAELKQQHREFMEQLIRIARIGRSLGVHLILATQKPDGVVDDQIKSNIRFKIALKVQDKGDSQRMIDRPDAAWIVNSGRFYFQVGNDEVFEYGQSPWSGALYEPRDQVRKNMHDYIEVLNEQGIALCRERVPAGKRNPDLPEKQIDAFVSFINQTAKEFQCSAEKLWLRPLDPPKEEQLKSVLFETKIVPYVLNPMIGMYDDLRNQKHLPLTVPFTEAGNALLYGAAGSGKLDFVNRLLISLMENHSPDEVMIYICDCDEGALSAFEESPHIGRIIIGEARIETEELMETINCELENRRKLLKKYGGDFQNYVRNSGKSMPNLLLIVHNYANFADGYTAAREKITRLTREGTKYGIYVLVTGSVCGSIPYMMQPLFKNTYTLRQNQDDQYREIIGNTGGILPEPFKGRGLVRVGGVACEFQTDLVFEEKDNVYEAIQQFCKELRKRNPKNEPFANLMEEREKGWSELVYQMDALPVAYDKRKRNVIALPVSKEIVTAVVYDEKSKAHKENFLHAIHQTGEKIICLDQKAGEKIDQLTKEMCQRKEFGLKAQENNCPWPDYEHLYLIMDGVEFLHVSDEQNVKLQSILLCQNINFHVHVIIIESAEQMKELATTPIWKRLCKRVRQGIVLTNDEFSHMMYKTENRLGEVESNSDGLVIINGNAVTAEMLPMKERQE